ncbi:hypothetical protein IVB03_14110 [Bradyrhizobium sp. 168]|uniref:phospholipase D-like domain-containing protein n=1 Tax=Bradyrhizobium sp. 168 TaxID=2782639 RepID=UPI001FFB691F|nr:phospholipase D-like domain-containing protein [Bradyrhizobium sp. 168]MCK1580686.1 hypothetical protein [Bradyrhizobium sp. 168]
MIETSNGADIDRLLDRVIGHPDYFAKVVLCSPFIDNNILGRIVPFAKVAHQSKCDVRIITSLEAGERIRRALQTTLRHKRNLLTVSPRLHAKVYLAVARRLNDTEVIVTSANLTCAGIQSNVELGVRAKSTSSSGRRFLNQVHRFISGLAA